MTNFGLKARLAAAGAVALALAGCDDRAGRVEAPEPATLADLSAMDALPYAQPARVEYRDPAQGYAWAERAYGLQRAVYDTPPDYGFEYGGVEPLAWETEDDWVMYAEPWDDGYRYYYYEPGADYPYFVRDDDYGYGYGAGGVLVAVFDAGGRYLPVDTVYRVAPTAGRYYARGRDLRSAANRTPRIQVTDQVWAQRAPQVIRTADPWLRAARDDGAWRDWRDRDQDRELRRFEREAARRAERTKLWRERDDRREAAAYRVAEESGRPGAGVPRQQADRERFDDRRSGREGERQAQVQRLAQQEQRQQIERQRRQQGEQQQRQNAERRQTQSQERARQEREQGEQRRRQHAERQQIQQRQQAEQQQRQHAQQQRQQQARQERQQMEQRHRQQAERQQHQQQVEQQRRQQASQHRQQAEQQRQQAQQQQQQRQQQAQARAAERQGQPAAARAPDGGKGQSQGNGRGHDRKD